MIICCGESLIDMVPESTKRGTKAFIPYCGGAVFNTAMALGRLGTKTSFISGISTDQFGDMLIEELARSNVNTHHAIRSDHLTCLAFVRLDNGQAHYTFYDEKSATRELRPNDIVSSLPTEANALFFGGISLMTEPCGSFYEQMAKRYGDNRLIAIDPNIRPSFIADENAYRQRIQRLIALADIIKLSDEDFCWLYQCNSVEHHFIEALLRDEGKIFVLTRGGDGAEVHRLGKNALFSPAQSTTVVDTIGAGDTFDAAFLHHLNGVKPLQKAPARHYSDAELIAAMNFANRAAAVTVSRAGANPPWRDEL